MNLLLKIINYENRESKMALLTSSFYVVNEFFY